MEPTLAFDVVGADGQPQQFTNSDLTQHLASEGENVLGMSPDGTMITMADSQGEFQVPAAQIWQQLGYQVQGFKPAAPDESRVDFGHRFAISQIGDEGRKRDYLLSKLRTPENPNPQIMGSGRDWYTFDPQSGKYIALTNKADWDLSDVAEGVPAVAKAIGSTAGGVAGGMAAAPTGVGVPMGVGMGAAAGNAAVDAGMRSLTGLIDPEYRKAQTWAEEGKQVGLDAAVSGVLGGGMAKVATMAPAMRTAMTTGPMSTLARGVGWTGEKLSSGVGKVAKFFGGGPVRQDIAASFVPGAMTPQIGSLVAQAPAGALVHGPALAAKAARSKFGSALLGDSAEGFAQGAESLLAKRSVKDPIMSLNRGVRGMADDVTARDVVGNIGQKAGKMLGKDVSKVASEAEEAAIRDMAESSAGWGVPDTASMAEEAGTKAAAAQGAKNAALESAGGRFGEGAGQIIENIGTAGRMVEKGIRGGTKAALKGTQYASTVPQYAFQGLRKAGEAMQPFENYLLARQGLTGLAEEQMSKRFPYKKPVKRSTLLVNK